MISCGLVTWSLLWSPPWSVQGVIRSDSLNREYQPMLLHPGSPSLPGVCHHSADWEWQLLALTMCVPSPHPGGG